MKNQLLIGLIFSATSSLALASLSTAPTPLPISQPCAQSATQAIEHDNFSAAISFYGLSIYAYEEQLEAQAFQRLNQNVQALLQQQERKFNQRINTLLEQELLAMAAVSSASY